MKARSISFLLSVLVVLPAAGEEPIGPQFQINSSVAGQQESAALAAAPDGSFLVVWSSDVSAGSDQSGRSIQAQLFDADGSPRTAETQVNAYTTGSQFDPDVGVSADGTFVVVWESTSPVESIRARRIDRKGKLASPEMVVESVSYSIHTYKSPVVASAASGEFVVVWRKIDYTNEVYELVGKGFGPDGTPLGSQSFAATLVPPLAPEIAATSDGSFVVVWEGGYDYIAGQRFLSDMSYLGAYFWVHEERVGSRPAVAPRADGGFIVTWERFVQQVPSQAGEGYEFRIEGRLFSSDATPLGDVFRVDTALSTRVFKPRVASSFDPGMPLAPRYLVAWESEGSAGSDDDGSSVQARWLLADGTPQGDAFQVNTFITGDQVPTGVATGLPGEALITWDSDGSPGDDDSGSSVQGQRIGHLIFRDAFESGDLSDWTLALP